MSHKVETKFRVGKRAVPVTLHYIQDDVINLHFPFNRKLIDIVKSSFEERKWLGPPIHKNGPKLWQIPVTQRNSFVLSHLEMREPYRKYDEALQPERIAEYIDQVLEYEWKRYPTECAAAFDKKPDMRGLLYEHQRELIAHALMTDTCIWAAEMGTGKTLAAYMWMEMTGDPFWWWVAPKSALRAFDEEERKWHPQVEIKTMTYEGLKSRVKADWPFPHCIVFDESPKIKTPNAQRSVAARNITNDMRSSLDGKHRILLMTGAPAPKSPLDWWHQAEVTEPGYLSEGNIFVFRETMGVFEDANDGAYKKHVMWRDNEEKCDVCGELIAHELHNLSRLADCPETHSFKESRDEVSRLHRRLKGLVIFKMKKDCLDLPDKIFQRRVLKPSKDVIKAARLIARTSNTVIQALTRMRMLSDGFQYVEEVSGHTVCKLCKGKCVYHEYFDPDNQDVFIPDEWVSQGMYYVYDDEGNVIEEREINYAKREVSCPNCGGNGRVDTYTRTVNRVPCPKDDALIEDLSAHEENGRLNIYAGFTATVDRVVEISQKEGWTTIRADGRGWEGKTPYGEILNNDKLLYYYHECQDKYPLMAFVGQPGAAGEGLTLTASHSTIFFSNDFNGNSRMQAEDRGHRIGMDKLRGGRIIDYLHLDSDLYVLLNLKQKKDLQKQSMTGLRAFLGV